MIYLKLFLIFFRVGLISFGGVFGILPEMQRVLVTEEGWITSERFIQAYVVGQFVPGPNMAMCPLLGYEIAGWGGWLVAFLGIYLGPVLIMAMTFAAYHRNREVAWVRRLEISLRPLVFALLLTSLLRLTSQQAGRDLLPTLLIGAPLLALHRTKRLSALSTIALSGAAWWAISRLLQLNS